MISRLLAIIGQSSGEHGGSSCRLFSSRDEKVQVIDLGLAERLRVTTAGDDACLLLNNNAAFN